MLLKSSRSCGQEIRSWRYEFFERFFDRRKVDVGVVLFRCDFIEDRFDGQDLGLNGRDPGSEVRTLLEEDVVFGVGEDRETRIEDVITRYEISRCYGFLRRFDTGLADTIFDVLYQLVDGTCFAVELIDSPDCVFTDCVMQLAFAFDQH